MASVNRVILIGNLGKDPETRYLPSGDAVANFSIATTEKFKDKSGAQQEHTEWHRISFFGRQAEIAGEYLKKGSPVYVEGRIRTRKWQDKEGQDRYTTEIVATEACASPPTSAVTCGAPPLYGTCTILPPIMLRYSSVARCPALPAPDDP